MPRLHPLCLLLLFMALCSGITISAQAAPPPKEVLLSHHAHGTFEVKMQPSATSAIDGVTRFSIDKQIHGDLEATSKGEMFGAGDFKSGSAGYVAVEAVTGSLAGKTGGFVLQHFATMNAGSRELIVKVAPGSGTGDLKGITGTFTIIIADGQHSYDFEYQLEGDKISGAPR